MNWTTPEDITTKVKKQWKKGRLLQELYFAYRPQHAPETPLFPWRFPIKRPNQQHMLSHYEETRNWLKQWETLPHQHLITWRTMIHPQLGEIQLPEALCFQRLDDALTWIKKQKEAQVFQRLLEKTQAQLPEVKEWLYRRPLQALELEKQWPQLLKITLWLRQNPRPKIYLRSLDLPGVHTKLIEAHRKILAELFDLVLPAAAIKQQYKGNKEFAQRYGFLSPPSRIRFRYFNSDRLWGLPDGDFEVTTRDFAALKLQIQRVFIVENQVTFLAFPHQDNALVVFGSGYGFEDWADITWLNQVKIYYWGDIDTHGMAILSQLRGLFPHVQSFLMDQETLLAHRSHWGQEDQPTHRELNGLTPQEQALYQGLIQSTWGQQLRLEQEQIRFNWLQRALEKLPPELS